MQFGLGREKWSTHDAVLVRPRCFEVLTLGVKIESGVLKKKKNKKKNKSAAQPTSNLFGSSSCQMDLRSLFPLFVLIYSILRTVRSSKGGKCKIVD